MTIKSKENQFVLLLIDKGNCNVSIHGNLFACDEQDLILFKPVEEAVLSAAEESCLLKQMILPVSFLQDLSDEQMDFAENFSFVPYDVAIVHTEIETVLVLKNLANKIQSLDEETYRFGLAYYEKALMSSFLIILLRACIQQDRYHKIRHRKELILDDVFVYIRNHLTEDLSLKKLESIFYVSAEHLCRKFKEGTGMSLHRYIRNARIDLSKRYLLMGMPVREVCQRCGFHSEAVYFRSFRKECGMTPSAYRRQYQSIPKNGS